MTPGRSCPLHYRYGPHALAGAPGIVADTLYVVGGLYGNVPALDALLDMVAREPGGATVVFNGDFNWFNVDDAAFTAVNAAVAAHAALRGNVETELASNDDAAGCGCAYPAWVGDAEVERSNRILQRLRDTARRHPGIVARLASLPMHLVAAVGGLRVAIVHGDLESLAGWRYAQESLAAPEAVHEVAADFARANARIIASSHTCLPVALELDTAVGRCALINNGSAGMPNFAGTQFGIVSRISVRPAPDALYGIRLDAVHVDAMAVRYDARRFRDDFDSQWPAGSDAQLSYAGRIASGPAYSQSNALRSAVSLAAQARLIYETR